MQRTKKKARKNSKDTEDQDREILAIAKTMVKEIFEQVNLGNLSAEDGNRFIDSWVEGIAGMLEQSSQSEKSKAFSSRQSSLVVNSMLRSDPLSARAKAVPSILISPPEGSEKNDSRRVTY